MSPATMYGKVLFDEALDPKENRFNNPYYDRTVWFMEDLMSDNIIDFCHRYLGMPNYEEMYDMILEFFRTIKNPIGAFRYVDFSTGNKFMYHLINNSKARQIYHLVDNSKKRNMIIVQERRPNINDVNNR